MKSFRSLSAIVTAWRGGVHCHFCGNSDSKGRADERCSRSEFYRCGQENRGGIYKKNGPSRDTELRIDRSALYPDHATCSVPGFPVRR